MERKWILTPFFFSLTEATLISTHWENYSRRWSAMNCHIKSFTALASLVLCLTGCARAVPLSVDRQSEIPLASAEKNIVLVNNTQYDLNLRRSLAKAGFNVKRFSSTKERERKSEGGTVTYSEAEARYGITQYQGGIVDYCVGLVGTTKNVKFNEYTLQIDDLRTNDVVMTISKGGWVQGCGFEGGNLFDELATALRENWK